MIISSSPKRYFNLKINSAGMSLLETMLALGILAAVLLPMSMQLPAVLRLMNNFYLQHRLAFVAQAMGEYFSRWGNNREVNLDTYWVENWETSPQWHDFEARNLNELIGVNVNLPIRFRVNVKTFDTVYIDKLGFIIVVYYDADASRDLSAADINRITLYTLLAQKGPDI